MMRIDGTDDPQSWEAIYQANDAGWDIGKPVPPFEELLKKRPHWLQPGKLICFGAGRGHDANLFAENDFGVTAVDFAPTAIQGIEKYSTKTTNLKAFHGDIFNLPTEFDGQFDYVLENTCFCAIPPKKRIAYANVALKMLKPDGILFGLFFRFDPPDNEGPPYTTSEDEIKKLFTKNFDILTWETPKVSYGKRQNRERLIALKVKK